MIGVSEPPIKRFLIAKDKRIQSVTSEDDGFSKPVQDQDELIEGKDFSETGETSDGNLNLSEPKTIGPIINDNFSEEETDYSDYDSDISFSCYDDDTKSSEDEDNLEYHKQQRKDKLTHSDGESQSANQQSPESRKDLPHRPLIKNGNKFLHLEIVDVAYQLANTCAYDSVFEIFVSIFLKHEEFQFYVLGQIESKFFMAIAGYVENQFDLNYFYRQRVDVLLNLNLVSDNLACTSTIQDLMDKLFQGSERDFYRLVRECDSCKNTRDICNVCFNFGHDIGIKYVKNGAETLASAIMESSKNDCKTIRTCSVCNSRSVVTRIEYGSMLFVDIENCYIYGSPLIAQNTPKRIQINAAEYQLVGFVEFSGNPSSVGHFIANFYDFETEKWEVRNDLADAASTKDNIEPGKKPSLLIYIRCDQQ